MKDAILEMLRKYRKGTLSSEALSQKIIDNIKSDRLKKIAKQNKEDIEKRFGNYDNLNL